MNNSNLIYTIQNQNPLIRGDEASAARPARHQAIFLFYLYFCKLIFCVNQRAKLSTIIINCMKIDFSKILIQNLENTATALDWVWTMNMFEKIEKAITERRKTRDLVGSSGKFYRKFPKELKEEEVGIVAENMFYLLSGINLINTSSSSIILFYASWKPQSDFAISCSFHCFANTWTFKDF